MTETTPDPADVHTGTDRGGCTCGEGDAVGEATPGPCYVDAAGFTVHRPRTADRVELTEDEFATVPHLSQLDSYADARDIKKAVERLMAARVQALTAERDRLRVDTNINADEVERQRGLLDLARAELAAANARCAEAQALAFKWLDYGEDTVEYRLGETLHSALSTPASPVTNAACDPTICCGAGTDCAAFAELHAEVEKWRTKYQQMMVSPRAEADELARRVDAGQKMEDTALDRASELRSENAALQATLDRVTEWADVLDKEAYAPDRTVSGMALAMTTAATGLRAALTPEGTP